jgi:hypothetical protein
MCVLSVVISDVIKDPEGLKQYFIDTMGLSPEVAAAVLEGSIQYTVVSLSVLEGSIQYTMESLSVLEGSIQYT